MKAKNVLKYRCLRFAVCCALLLAPLLSRAQTADSGRESILIISSYNPDTRRMASFITDFERQIVATDLPCDIYVETLECKGVDDAPRWMSQIDNLITRYEERRLRAIVLLGQEAWASFVSLGRFPEGVMCFSCFVSANGIMLPPPAADSARTWMPPMSDYRRMADSLDLVGGLLNRYDISGNVELVRSLYPETETFAFVSDNTYGGISLQALVRSVFEKNYPDLNLVLIDSRDGDRASHDAYASLPLRSAVLLGTWRVGRDGEYLMQSSLNELVSTNPRIPIFSVTRTGIGDVALGGYVPEYESGSEVIASQIRAFYKTGSVDAVHFHQSRDVYVFDSRKLKEWKIAEYSLPRGSIVQDTLAVKLSKYSYYIELLVLGIVLLLLLLVFVGVLLFRTQRLRRTLEVREEQLVVAREKAEESDMLKSAFLANMSHEIRTPLNAIVGFSSLMQDGDLSQEERSEYCSIVVNNSEMLLTLLIFVAVLLMRTRRLKRTLEEREEQLVVAREKAEESDMLKSAFLANMSHEIRTPLNAIVGFSSLMQSEDITAEERGEYCSIVVSNSEMLLTLLNDILDISSLECGKIRFNYSSEDVVQICQHVIMTTAHTRQEGVECRFECALSTFRMTTDAHRLSQILINLLTNAGKFTSEGSITLALEIDREQHEAVFSVSDTGPGIPLDKQEAVFNRFEKLEGNMKKGTGLGLAICRQIAMIFGGRIWVDSTYTGGARFVFTHPIDLHSEDGERREGGGDLAPRNAAKPSV